jgi:Thiamine pyrophosphate enzyme, C-terminal TPP binding domain
VGVIGWATPAAFGAALAAPERRTILISGEGSHQLTAQEVLQFHRFGLKPIIFLLNNDGYLIERLLCKEPDTYYKISRNGITASCRRRRAATAGVPPGPPPAVSSTRLSNRPAEAGDTGLISRWLRIATPLRPLRRSCTIRFATLYSA